MSAAAAPPRLPAPGSAPARPRPRATRGQLPGRADSAQGRRARARLPGGAARPRPRDRRDRARRLGARGRGDRRRPRARAAQVAASHRVGRGRSDAVEEVAYALMTFPHVERTTTLVARLAAELPFARLRRATRTLAHGCEELALDLDGARATTAALLIAYAGQRRHAA